MLTSTRHRTSAPMRSYMPSATTWPASSPYGNPLAAKARSAVACLIMDSGLRVMIFTTTTTESGALISSMPQSGPPFSLAPEFIRKADSLGVEYMALILKAHFWHAKRRTALFAEWSPARIYAMNWRPQFGDKGSPTMDFIWCVWDRRTKTPTTYEIMEKPYD